MKTADRILETARTLFNERGERNVTANDVALELDMSAGNLYYHFKGKDSMHIALFSVLQRELVGLLGAPLQDPTLFRDSEDDSPVLRCWLFLTVVLEKMLEYRYLYENPRDLMYRFPEIDRGFRRLIKLKRAACKMIALELLNDILDGDNDPGLERLTDTMTLTLTYWLAYDKLANPDDHPVVVVHRGVLQLLASCAPYLGTDQQDFYRECEKLYRHMANYDEY